MNGRKNEIINYRYVPRSSRVEGLYWMSNNDGRYMFYILFLISVVNATSYHHYQYPFSIATSFDTTEDLILMVDDIPLDESIEYYFKISVVDNKSWCIEGEFLDERCSDQGSEYTYSNDDLDLMSESDIIIIHVIENEGPYMINIEWSIEGDSDDSDIVDKMNIALYILVITVTFIGIIYFTTSIIIYCICFRISSPSK